MTSDEEYSQISKETEAGLAQAFDIFGPIRLQSPLLEKLFRDTYGDEYPEGTQMNAYYTQSVINKIVRSLSGLTPDDNLVDIGCGHGVPGRHIAKQLGGVKLVGIDISPKSINIAREVAAKDGDQATFVVGTMDEVNLPSGLASGVISLDVLLYAPDKQKTLNEAARLLKPGGIFAFTVWEQEGWSPRLEFDQLLDYTPVMRQAGFEVLRYEEVEGWKTVQGNMLRATYEHEARLTQDTEMGPMAGAMFAQMSRGAEAEIPKRRYVLGIGRKK